jgi:hypothetical protein
MKKDVRHALFIFLLLVALILEFGAFTLRAGDGIPCTDANGFYHAVCPVQPEVSNRRVVDGSGLSPLPPDARDAPRVVDGSKLFPPQHTRRVAESKPSQAPASGASAAPGLSVFRKTWRNYTMTDWMSIASIFLLATIVGVVFYLVNRTIQSERRTAA